jgi:hypothetical protein
LVNLRCSRLLSAGGHIDLGDETCCPGVI